MQIFLNMPSRKIRTDIDEWKQKWNLPRMCEEWLNEKGKQEVARLQRQLLVSSVQLCSQLNPKYWAVGHCTNISLCLQMQSFKHLIPDTTKLHKIWKTSAALLLCSNSTTAVPSKNVTLHAKSSKNRKKTNCWVTISFEINGKLIWVKLHSWFPFL